MRQSDVSPTIASGLRPIYAPPGCTIAAKFADSARSAPFDGAATVRHAPLPKHEDGSDGTNARAFANGNPTHLETHLVGPGRRV